eukprot:COSAG03_NODE_768_length_5947_cov_22.170361_6_plen_129_part_00
MVQFVTASLGQTAMNDTKSGGGLILQAMENVASGTKYPEFKGNVATVYTHPLEHTPVWIWIGYSSYATSAVLVYVSDPQCWTPVVLTGCATLLRCLRQGSSGGHYGDDAYTYMNVGEAMGKAMAALLK